jgi:hypothetical protein
MNFKNIQIVFFQLLILKFAVFSCQFVTNDQSLKKVLLANYSKTSHLDDFVSVKISLMYFRIIGIDEKIK